MNPEEIAQAIADVQAQLQTIADAVMAGTASAEDVAKLDELEKSLNDLNSKKALIEKAATLVNNATKSTQEAKELSVKAVTKVNALPAPTSNVEVKSTRKTTKHYADDASAIKAAKTILAASGHKGYAKWAMDNNIEIKTFTEGNNTDGGYLVPEDTVEAVMNLREQYGVFRKYARSASGKIIVNTSETNVFAISEGGAFTETSMGWKPINFTPKKFGAYFRYSSELNDDALVNIADEIANDLALAFAQKEDECGFVGDGTGTYNGIVGLNYTHRLVLEQAGGTWTNDTHKGYLASAVVAAGNAWSEITAANLDAMKAKLSSRATNIAFFCSPEFKYEVFTRLMGSPSGNTTGDFATPLPQTWRGIPIIEIFAMPTSEANSQVPLILGDLSKSSALRVYKEMTLDTTTGTDDFFNDIIPVRAKIRLDINNTLDAGNYNATAANRRKGSFVSLITQNA